MSKLFFYVKEDDGHVSVHEPGLNEDLVREAMMVALRQEHVDQVGEEAEQWTEDQVADEMGNCEGAYFWMRYFDLSELSEIEPGASVDGREDMAGRASIAWQKRCELGRLYDWLGGQMKALDHVVVEAAGALVEVEEGHKLGMTLNRGCPDSPTGLHFQERLSEYIVKIACPFCGQPALKRQKEHANGQ